MADISDAAAVLESVGFVPEQSVLTHRQAEVLCLREQGYTQVDIAEWLGTSRANVSSIESSARANVEKARETIAFTDALKSPVQVSIETGKDLYDVPSDIYSACDDADVKVNHTAPELMKHISDAAGDAIRGREVRRELLVGVTNDGRVRVRSSD
jgi:Tfx family DNA-binding protein